MADTLREVGIAFVSTGERELLSNLARVDQAERSLEKTSRSLESTVKRQIATEEEAIRAYAALEKAGMGYAQIQKALVQDAKMLDAANQKAVNSMLGVDRATKSARQSANVFSQTLRDQEKAEKAAVAELQRHERELEQLATKYKPLYAASKQYERALDEINRAHALGVLNTKQQTLAVDALQKEYQAFQNNTAGWENQFVQGGQRSARELNRTGMAVQQLGYQTGDFLVQVQSGTNWMVAFGQQATQLAGLIGVLNKSWIGIGATLGIVIPLITAVGAAWMRTREGMDEAGDSVKALENDIKSIDGTIRDFLRTQEAMSRGISIDELIAVDSIEAATDALEEAQSKLEEFQNKVTSPGYGAAGGIDIMSLIGMGETDAFDAAVAAVEAAEQRLAVLRRKASTERTQFVSEERAALEANLRLQEIEIQYGSESVQYLREQVAQERAILVKKMEQERVGAETQKSLLAIFDTTNDLRLSNEAYTAGLEAAKNFWEEISDRAAEAMDEIRAGYAATIGPSQTLRNETEAYVTEMAEVFKQAQNLREELGDAAFEALRLAGVDIASGVDAAARAAAALAADLGISLARAIAMQGMLNDEDLVMSQPVVTKPATERFGVEDLLRMGYTEEYLRSIGKIRDATKGAGRATRETKEEISDLEKAFGDAYYTADEFAEKMALDLVDATGDLADAMSDFIVNGLSDFEDFASSVLNVFKKMISEMISIAIRNEILIGLGFGGLGSAGTAAANAAGLAGGGGGAGGIFSVGNLLQGVGTFTGGVMGGAQAALGLGGYASAGLFNVTANATAASAVTGAGAFSSTLGAALPVLGAVTAAVSFFTTKTKHLDNGLRVTADNTGVLVEEFNKVEKSRFWGLSKSINLTFDEASEEIAAPIRKSINDITTSIAMAGEELGLTADNFSSWSTEIQVSLKGLDEAAQDAEIQRIFDTVAEQFSYAALGSFNEAMGGQLIREGENAAETMDALVVSLAVANDAFRLVNQTMFEASVIGADMARQLVDAAGGVGNFNAAFSGYFTAFYTQEEQLSMRTQRLARTMEDLGVAMPATNAQFRDLVEAQDLTTEGGRNTYAQLLLVSGEFAQLTALSEELYGAASLAASGIGALIQSLASAVTEAEAALEAAKQVAIAEYNNVMRIIDAQINDARRTAQAAYRNALSIMDGQIREAETARDAIRSIFDILHDGLRQRSLLEESTQIANRGRLRDELAGGISDPSRLREVISDLNEPSEKFFGSFTDYARDYYRTSNIIAAQKKVSEGQLSEAESQIKLLEDQKQAIQDQYGPLVGIEENTADLDQAIQDIVENAEELEALEAQKQAIQDLYGPLLGIDENTDELDAALARLEEAIRDVEAATVKVEDAIGALAAALIQMVSGIRGTQGLAALGADAFSVFSDDNTNAILSDEGVGVLDSVAAQINELYNNVLDRNVDVAGLDYYGSRLQSGEASLGRIDYALRTSGEALDGDTPGFGNIGAGGGGQDPVEALYGAMLGTQPDPAGVEFWKSTGLQGEALINAFRDGALANGQIPKFARGGLHSGGLAIVGEEGPELVDMSPSRVYDNASTMRMMSNDTASSSAKAIYTLNRKFDDLLGYTRRIVKISIEQERQLTQIKRQGTAA